MSYDVWLEIDTGGEEPYVLQDEYWNYTSNCAPMWRAAGMDLAEFHGKPAAECTPILHAGLLAMDADAEKYRAMNPANGWGDFSSLKHRLCILAEWFERHPKATVRVSR